MRPLQGGIVAQRMKQQDHQELLTQLKRADETLIVLRSSFKLVLECVLTTTQT